MKSAIVFDVDGTLCGPPHPVLGYAAALPNAKVLSALRAWKQDGYRVILSTSRGMRTHSNNVGAVIADRAFDLIGWLNEHKVPFDELHFGKPWCGSHGFYVDDRAVRPREFCELSSSELETLLERDRP